MKGHKQALAKKCTRWGFSFETGVPTDPAGGSGSTSEQIPDKVIFDWEPKAASLIYHNQANICV